MIEGDANRRANPLKRHRAQAAWQIWVPLGMAIALVVTLCVFSALATMNDLPISKTLAPVTVIWVLIPYCLSGLIPLAILFGCVFLTAKMLGGLPRLGARILAAFMRMQKLAKSLSDRVAAPVVKAGSLQAGWVHFWKTIWPGKSHGEGA